MVDVDGPTHYLDFGGPSEGPLVVCVHGLGGSHLNWLAVGPSLSLAGRVMALDLVGHGRTPAVGRTATIEGHRALLGGFIEAVGNGSPAIVVGNSMGGLVGALQAAVEPESVAGLVLIDPALPTARPGLIHPRVLVNFVVCAVPGLGEGYLAERRRRASAEQTVRRVLGVCCVDAARVDPDVVEAHVRLTASLDRAAADRAYLSSARSLSMIMARPGAIANQLGGLRQPTLLIHGERDRLVPMGTARRMATTHPRWRFEIAPDIGHVPMLEAPAWTTSVIDDWMTNEGAAAVNTASIG
jgi:pimeloyl-ACP methyl ester carboxylesterase